MIQLIISLVGIFLTVWLGGARSLWHPSKPMSKRWLFVLLVLAVLAQGTSAWLANRRSQKDASLLSNLESSNKDLLLSNKALVGKLDQATSLIRAFNVDSENRALRLEAKTLLSESKMEQNTEAIRKAVDDRKGFGEGGFGSGPFGGGEPPLSRIASSLQSLAVWFSNEAMTWLVRNDAWGPRRQVMEYYTAVEKIPSFYNNTEWSAAEELIFEGIRSDISSNLSWRNINSTDALDRYSGALLAERKRYLAARARGHH